MPEPHANSFKRGLRIVSGMGTGNRRNPSRITLAELRGIPPVAVARITTEKALPVLPLTDSTA
ncbi:MAG: hypothetical protein Q7U78_15180 [Gallionella sp.]|nr:hypothetical protein [Gallionella sp.]